jgi:NADPH-dependent 7-cyano-7-deazaguanine reductase QueF-like protein
LVTDKIEVDADYEVVKYEEGKGVPEKSIIETINLNLYLNFRQQTETEKKMQCKGCICKQSENKIQIEIKGNAKPVSVCKEQCTVLCYWMMKKHDYLVEELKALYDYLNTVNNSLFESRINLNFIFQKEIGLDADMFSDIQEYLGI